MTVVLQTRDLRREFGALVAVEDVSIEIDDGGVTSIIGPNGAGKTTLYDLLSGRLAPTAGTVRLRGRDGDLEDVTGLPAHEIARRGLSRAFQINNLFEGLSVLENVRVARISVEGRARSFAASAEDPGLTERAREVLELTGLAGAAAEPCANLPHGDKRKVEIAVALATDPSVVLLDEPTAGMTPTESGQLVELIRDLDRTTDTTFVVTEHDMDVVFDVADRVLVLHRGALIADGSPAEVRADETVAEAYLGETA